MSEVLLLITRDKRDSAINVTGNQDSISSVTRVCGLQFPSQSKWCLFLEFNKAASKKDYSASVNKRLPRHH